MSQHNTKTIQFIRDIERLLPPIQGRSDLESLMNTIGQEDWEATPRIAFHLAKLIECVSVCFNEELNKTLLDLSEHLFRHRSTTNLYKFGTCKLRLVRIDNIMPLAKERKYGIDFEDILDSIRLEGLWHPTVGIYLHTNKPQVKLIDGWKRVQAFRILGLVKIPMFVYPKE